jgi:DsbC/DsbD-like thiol-disulfide interchange protein
MTKNRIVFACALVAAASTLSAEHQIEIPDWESSVQFRLVTSQQPIRPGDSFSVALVAEIEDGYHLYGPEEPYPSRTEVTLSGENLEVGEAVYPSVETRELSGLGTYDLYEGSIAIRFPVKLSDSGEAGKHTVKATVNYQVCTDFACSAPTSDELTVTVTGGKAGVAVEKQHPDIFKSK